MSKSNSFVVNVFSTSLTHTRLAVVSIRSPRISIILFFSTALPVRRSYLARCAFTLATSSLGLNGFQTVTAGYSSDSLFENDVKMYGIQTNATLLFLALVSLRMM